MKCILSLMILALTSLSFASLEQSGSKVGSQAEKILGRSVNITRWFCYLGNPQDYDHMRNYYTAEDTKALKKLGVKMIRLCVAPPVIYDQGKVRPEAMTLVDAGIKRLMKDGFTVAWDLHDNGQIGLDKPGYDPSQFIDFWKILATRYKGKFEAQLAFELVNEPVFMQNAPTWYEIQQKAVDAIRAIDPQRTIVVTSTGWSGVDAFAKMPKVKGSNLIYTFHCYDPFFFTHQGAEWVGEYPQKLKHVPFPADPEAVDAIIDDNEEKYRDALFGYGKEGYDNAYLLKRIETAVQVGKKYDVPVWLGEFGAYPKVAKATDRARWFQGMKAAIDHFKLPAAIWGYDDALGLGRKMEDGKLDLDLVVLRHFYGQ
ncbi:MAG: cellulase family glycosylhydrolase [Armatimonadetes bacterium]|nr:cellulase family glycosylhydrolase [Armatimonadota bacterium]